MPFQPGKTVHFLNAPARPARCAPADHQQQRAQRRHPPDEALLVGLRQGQATPVGRARPPLRERVQAGHALAHVGHWQGRRASYRGTRKNLFDLRRIAVVHNLHVIARQPTAGDYQLAA